MGLSLIYCRLLSFNACGTLGFLTQRIIRQPNITETRARVRWRPVLDEILLTILTRSDLQAVPGGNDSSSIIPITCAVKTPYGPWSR